MYETAIPMGKMLNAFLAIHGRCKFIIFLRGQTPSLSAPTLILSLMEHFQGKAKNTVKHSIKSTFSISIQLNCNWLPGNPQLPPYIYIYMQDIKQLILSILLLDYTINENFILKKLDDPSLLSIIWMVKIQYWFGFNPYENMSSSVGIMKFPIYIWKVIKFQHQPVIIWSIIIVF